MRYFWREKNADKFLGRFKVERPDRQSLERELILKLEQKLGRLDVVFDKEAREKYYQNDPKPKKSLEGLTEKEIVRLLGTNLAVDFLQLCFDFCDFYGFDKLFESSAKGLTLGEVKGNLNRIIEDLKNGTNKEEQMENLFGCAVETAGLSDAMWEDVEALRSEKEEDEGTFFNGKYVDFGTV